MGKRKSCKLKLVEGDQVTKSNKLDIQCENSNGSQSSEFNLDDLPLSSNLKESEDNRQFCPDLTSCTESKSVAGAPPKSSNQLLDHKSIGKSIDKRVTLESEVPGNDFTSKHARLSEIESHPTLLNVCLSEISQLSRQGSLESEEVPLQEGNDNANFRLDGDDLASFQNLRTSNADFQASVDPCEMDLLHPSVSPNDEKWDIVRKLDTRVKVTCRVAGCRRRAVECWASNVSPDDEWNMCRKCIQLDFGIEDSEKVLESFDETKKHDSSPVIEPLMSPSTLSSLSKQDVLEEKNEMNISVTECQSSESQIVSPEPEMEAPVIEQCVNITSTFLAHDSRFNEHQFAQVQENLNQTLDHTIIEEKKQSFDEWMMLKRLAPQTKEICEMTGCSFRAIELWASNIDPKIQRNICETCRSEFEPINAKNSTKVKSCEKGTITANEENEITRLDLENLEDEEKWDIQKIISMEELMREGTIKCSAETCSLAAAALYCSTNLKEKWYSCLDCQLSDFGGWPEKLEDIPIKYMTNEHKKLMAKKCSRLSCPTFPKFPKREKDLASSAINEGKDVEHKQGQPSVEALEIHRKWQAAAEAMGGPDARIIVEKKKAKKIIFALLYDSFRPMNITQIFSSLNAVVPSPVLKQCLDEMVIDNGANVNFADSDDDETKSAIKRQGTMQKDEFSDSLIFKTGKNSNTSLYYIDHTKQSNQGNGLDIDNREKLLSEKTLSEQNVQVLTSNLLQAQEQTKCLQSEPTNENLESQLETLEIDVADLKLMVQDARKFKVNESTKKNIKERIDGMTLQWRKRRRLCMEFLINLEENTDGSINLKKCLTGDGQIDIETDEKAISDSRTYAESRRSRKQVQCKRKSNGFVKTSDYTDSTDSNVNLIGVFLDSQGNVNRVYLD
jgi:hypothetical protein